MLPQEVIEYLNLCKAQAIPFPHVAEQLKKSGWNDQIIEEAEKYYTLQQAVSTLPIVTSGFVQPGLEQPVQGEKPKSSRKVFLTGIFLFLFFCISLVTVSTLLAYEKISFGNAQFRGFFVHTIVGLPFVPKTPRYVLEQSVLAQSKQTKLSLDASIAVAADGLNTFVGENSFDMAVKGPIDYTVVSDPQFAFNASITNLLNFDIRHKKKKLFFKINKFPDAILGMYASSLQTEESLIKDKMSQWWFTDTVSLNTQAKKTMEKYKEEQKKETLTTKTLNKIIDTKIIPATTMSSEQVDGFSTYKLHATATAELINALGDVLYEGLDESTEGSSRRIKFSEYIQNMKVDLWVDKKNYYLRQMTVAFQVKPTMGSSSLLSARSMANGISKSISVVFALTLADFGVPVVIQTPENAKNFLDLAKEIAPQRSQLSGQQGIQSAPTATPIPTGRKK